MENQQSVDMTLPRSERIALAYQTWKDAKGRMSMKAVARRYGVGFSTLQGRIKGAISKEDASRAMQRLSTAEEDSLRDWTLLLFDWGWPPQKEQLRGLATELLKARGDTKDLGVHWSDHFLERYPEVKTRFILRVAKDQKRPPPHDPGIVKAWFELFQSTVTKYNIHRDDIYNMGQMGIMLRITEKDRFMISRSERRKPTIQATNMEWVAVIECMATTGRLLPPWFSFKSSNPIHMQMWHDIMRGTDGHIAVSNNGWTGKEDLPLEWFQTHFQYRSLPLHGDSSGYRLLILDSYGWYASLKLIKYCMASKIILLCRPRNLAQFLQPLDVGVYGPLSAAYEDSARAQEHESNHSVDEAQFLNYYLPARGVITIQCVQKAWKEAGLDPFDPEIVLTRLPPIAAPKEATSLPSDPNEWRFSPANGDRF